MPQIRIQDDFSLEKIADSGQCFRCRQAEDGAWVFITGRHMLRIRSVKENVFDVSCDRSTWDRVWHPYFDLDRNYARIRSDACGLFSYLDHALDTGAGLRILRQDPWEMLITFILSQRRSIPVIRRSVQLICEAFGEKSESHIRFPSPEALAQAGDEPLRQCCLGYRAPYVRKTAAMISQGIMPPVFPDSLSTPELLDALMTFPGVGRKVANCVALFGYGRMDAAPVDTWIARVIEEDFGGKAPFDTFPETAGIIQQYLFYTKRADSREHPAS